MPRGGARSGPHPGRPRASSRGRAPRLIKYQKINSERSNDVGWRSLTAGMKPWRAHLRLRDVANLKKQSRNQED